MIFTIGEEISFAIGFKREHDTGVLFMKRGAGYIKGQGSYRGGAVFQTREAAQAFADSKLEENWHVYGVDADWEKHTQQYDGEEFSRLVIDRKLIQLDSE